MDFVAIDLGASNTRYVSVDKKVNFIPNNVTFVEDLRGDLGNESLDNILENNLDVTIEKASESPFFPLRALVGSMSSRFSDVEVRPSQMIPKHKQRINYLSSVLAVALSKIKNNGIGDNINLFIALPPVEVTGSKDIVISNLIGKYKVTFNKVGVPNTVVEFSINDVACYEESRLALLQFIFDEKHPERMSKFSNTDILSIDIGASTTDFVIFKQGKYQNKTGNTIRYGGNVARDYVITEVERQLGKTLSIEAANQALIEGRVKNGNKAVPIPDIVEKAKSNVARGIVRDIDSYFTRIGTPLTEINYIIVSGGGSVASGYTDDDGKHVTTSKPMSDYITNALIDICDGIEVIHYGDEPRLANIYGLGKLALLSNGEIIKK